MISTLAQLYAKKIAAVFAMVLGVAIWAGCARWITNLLRSVFGFSDDVETIILGVSFFALPFVGYWLFDRYDNWRAERKLKSWINADAKDASHTPSSSEMASSSAARGTVMRILRYFLLAASVIGIAFIVYGLNTYKTPPEGKVFIFAIAAALVLNFIYIFWSPPDNTMGSRYTRLWSLWLDAKERELKERAGKPPRSE